MMPIDSDRPSRYGLSRRKFIFLSAVAAGGAAAGGCVAPRSRPRVVSANEKLNIAIVGFAGQGASDAECCAGENIVALCDADQKVGSRVRERYPKAVYYQDFRQMLDKEKSLDALNIAVPDHLHAYIAATAMKLGKHVYVQKPLTHSVYEARLLRHLAAKTNVATQMGNQGSAENGLRRAVEVIQAGIIGQVTDVHVWSNRPIWPQGLQRPTDSDPVPEGLDWDLWLGPAPQRPYKGLYLGNNAYHPFNWRGWIDFGTGALGDMACHTVNLPFRALKLGYPTEIEAETVDLTKDSYPIKSRIRFQFPAREGLAPVSFRWYDGGNRVPNATQRPFHDGNNKPPPEVTADILTIRNQIPRSGCLILGDKGQIFSPDDYGTRFYLKLKDEKEFTSGATHQAATAVPQTIPRNPFMSAPGTNSGVAHHQEWIAACKGGAPGYSNFDIAAYLTEIILLGCVAMRAGRKLEWDGPNMRARNAPETAEFVHPAFRKGWHI
ncbi:MAG: Gfo/Idh/MocA family oxidoreductase [Verrucomicrobiota bacterium]|jgi:predicted dehydrogenase